MPQLEKPSKRETQQQKFAPKKSDRWITANVPNRGDFIFSYNTEKN